MVSLAKLKSYLRIDTDYEDELLQNFLVAAQAYLTGAVSNYTENSAAYPEFKTKADLLTMVLAAEFYQNRDNSAHDLSYTVRSLMTQLQYFAGVTNEDKTSDTVTVPTGTFVILDANGNLVDSGITVSGGIAFTNFKGETVCTLETGTQ